MRTKKALYNIISSMLLQLVTIVCGFIVPKVIISHYGSEVNGITSSITQFLGYITLIEAGIGGVVRATLYGPLAKKNNEQISKIIKAADVFFKRIAKLSILYILLLAIFYPIIANTQFDYWFTFSLVIIIGASTFAQYFFGITYQLLLQADQRQYVGALLQSGTLILNVILVVILTSMNCSIVVVKLASSIAFILRPIIINIFVRKRYDIDAKCIYDKKVLKRKRDGFSQHIAYFLHTNTDIVVLTIFSNLKDVSVYSVYNMVVVGVQKIVAIFSSGVEAAFGNMLANGEKKNLQIKFGLVEVFVALISSILFVVAIISIEPFLKLYTSGFNDADYQRPFLGIFLILAEYMYCIRMPYNSLIIAAGHFRETKMSAYIEAGINIVLSVLFVNWWGIYGVAFATFVAMVYRTLYYAFYLQRNLIERSIWLSLKKVILVVIAGAISILLCNSIGIFNDINGYLGWALRAFVAFLIVAFIYILFWRVFYPHEFMLLWKTLGRIKKKRRKNADNKCK